MALYFATMRCKAWTVGALLVTLSMTARAQLQQSAFDVISIKPLADDKPYGRVEGNRYTAHGITLDGLLYGAYRVTSDRIINLPDWAKQDSFEVIGTAEREIQDADLPVMLQSLLRDRFALRAHREMRESPVYRLQIAKPGAPFRPVSLRIPIAKLPECDAEGAQDAESLLSQV